MYLLPPLVPPLALPSPTSVTVSPASPTSTSVACVLVVLISVLLLVVVSRRWAGRVAAAPVAALAEGIEEADFPGVNLCLRHRALLGLLHLDYADGVALAVPLA